MLIRSKNWDMSEKENMYAVQVEALRKIIKENQKTIERLENTINELIVDMIAKEKR